ncbi:MAG: hypothetical protein MRY83_17610 [Flavobacteriales bacterium]|nr:hypothetical protein [Flavobacteriales bacterium]
MSNIFEIIEPFNPLVEEYYFLTDHDLKYQVKFGRKKNDLSAVTVVFGVLNEEFEGDEYVETNKGDMFRVMNTVVEVVRLFSEKNDYIRSFEFTGEPRENEDMSKPTARLKLFHRFAERYAKNHGWKVLVDKNTIVVNR